MKDSAPSGKRTAPVVSSRGGNDCSAPPSAPPAGGVIPNGTRVARASFAAIPSPSSHEISSSGDLGWRSILARAFVVPDRCDGYTTTPTPDLLVSLNIGCEFTVESRTAGGWTLARPQPDSVGMTAPDRYNTLRWRSESNEPLKLFHMFLSAGMLQETAEDLGRPGLIPLLPDALVLQDPVVPVIARALITATATRADALHADSLAQALAVHIVYRQMLGSSLPQLRSMSGPLSSAVLEQVVDYIQDNLGNKLNLDDLSAVASLSKFHFVRAFKLATGVPPHRYLTTLRMLKAAQRLRSSNDTVQQISASCGYSSPGQFANAFRRHHGVNPTQYRRDAH